MTVHVYKTMSNMTQRMHDSKHKSLKNEDSICKVNIVDNEHAQ